MQGLYIHVPICSGKCRYCDFYSRPDISQETYLSALERELALRPASSCETLYVGGGTPSQLTPENIARLCALIEKYSRPIHASHKLKPRGLAYRRDSACRRGFAYVGVQGKNRPSASCRFRAGVYRNGAGRCLAAERGRRCNADGFWRRHIFNKLCDVGALCDFA